MNQNNNSIHSIHHSYWLQHEPLKQRFDALASDHQTEILVIGAGISGLSTALELLERGRKVTVCEANVIGAGTTGGSSAHLDAHPEQGPKELIKHFGEQVARECVSARLSAIDRIGERAGDYCEFVRVPAFSYSESESSRQSLQEDMEGARTLGLDVQWCDHVPLPRAACGYRINQLARIDCMLYLRRLTELVVEAGGKIFERTRVSGPMGEHPTQLEAGGQTISFEHVVTAVHCNITDSMRIYLETPAYQSYVMAVRVRNAVQDALYWDDADPYHYVRRAGHGEDDLLLVGGCDHRTGAGNEREAIERLEQWVRDRFEVREIVARWSAEYFQPVDGLPLIGRVAHTSNSWIITGLSGIGLTWGTAAGEIVANLIQERPVNLAKTLSPARFGASSPGALLREQATSAMGLAKRVLPSHSVDPAKLGAGQGEVGKVDGCHVAICRDAQGNLHRHSPICTHMGGVVEWNEFEQTWDCPVHGGRFSADGCRIYGPPEAKLGAPEK